MTGLLHWLSREKDIETALIRLLNVIPTKERDIVRAKLERAISMYKLEPCHYAIENELYDDVKLRDVIKGLFSDNRER